MAPIYTKINSFGTTTTTKIAINSSDSKQEFSIVKNTTAGEPLYFIPEPYRIDYPGTIAPSSTLNIEPSCSWYIVDAQKEESKSLSPEEKTKEPAFCCICMAMHGKNKEANTYAFDAGSLNLCDSHHKESVLNKNREDLKQSSMKPTYKNLVITADDQSEPP